MSSRGNKRRPQPNQTPVEGLSRTLVVQRRQFSGRWTLVFGVLLALVVGVWWATGLRGKWVAQDHTPVMGGSAGESGRPAAPITAAEQEARGNQAFKAQINHGTALLAQGKPDEALQALSEALKINPNDEDVHYDLGLVLTRLGRTAEAIEQYQQSLKIFPRYVEAHNNLGNLLMRAGRNDEAIQHFEQALQIMPDFASAHNNLGTALERAGRTNEATLHFERAIQIDPDYWQARFNVALNRFADGRLEDARTELKEVLRRQPDFAPAKAALEEVQAQAAK